MNQEVKEYSNGEGRSTPESIVFYSFWHSQGCATAQFLLLKKVNELLLGQNRSPVDFIATIQRETTKNKIYSWIRSKCHHEVSETDAIENIIGDYRSKAQQTILTSLICSLIEQEYEFNVTKRKQRQRPNDKTTFNTFSDPWLSQLCHYGLRGNPCPCSVYNPVFCHLNNEMLDMLQQRESTPWSIKLRAILEEYKTTHADKADVIAQVINTAEILKTSNGSD